MSRQFTLGVLSPFLGGWYFGGIMTGIARAGHQLDANIIAIQTFDAGTEQIEIVDPPAVRYPIAWDHLSGFVVILRAASPAYLAAAQRAGKPVVVIGHDFADLDAPVVLPDNGPGVRDAVSHLIAHGHSKIAFAGYLGASDIQERLQAYRETLLAHDITPDPRLLFEAGDNHQGGGELAGRRMADAGVPSTAVVVGTDANAAGVMRMLVAAGLTLPRDQAIVGFDDQRIAAYVSPSLTTVRQPVEMLGRAAVTETIRLVRGGAPGKRHLYVPTALVVRESCGCAHGRWPDAAATTGPPFRAELTERLVAAVSPVPDELPSDAVDHDVEVIADAIDTGSQTTPVQPQIPFDLQQLVTASGRPEVLMDMVNTVWDYGRSTMTGAAGADIDRLRRASAAIEAMMLTLMETHGRAQFHDNVHLQEMLSQQYEVSTELLRGHREDPRRLAWLVRTPTRAGCLGLWTPHQTVPHSEAMLDIVGVFRRDGPPPQVRSPVAVAAFPPAHLLDLASEQADGVVFVVPVRVDTSDWGLLAIVDTTEPEVATGREPINQWAALLSHTLDYDKMVQDLRTRTEQLRVAALYDSLTGLPNRSLFLERLRDAIARGRRSPDHRFSVLFLDLDGFKVVNDSLGHAAGDRLLAQVATRIRENLRDTDTAARFGGDEFLVLIDGIESVQTATEIAERVQASLTRPFHLQDQDVVISASTGITFGGSRYADAEDLVRDADVAMYWAKSQLKGSHAVFDMSMRTRAVERLQIEIELRRAVERREIEAYFQPIVHMPSGRIHAFEALARWRHPSRGLLAPADFLHVAEETGLIAEIGQQILAESCQRLSAWRSATGRDLHVSVNVSDRQLWAGTLVGVLAECLRAARLDGECLALELTESVVMRDVRQARTVLEEIHALGCELFIDDFGTGYSSLEALHQLPIDALKIDRSFISRLGTDPKSGDLVDSIIHMGHKLGLLLIAEGVETAEQREHLLRLHCAYGQGYLFSAPVPADEAEALLRRS